MKFQEIIKTGSAKKHVEGPIAGTYLVDKANISAGYYFDFQPDDNSKRSSINTSSYWGPSEIGSTIACLGEDGWER